MQGKELVIDAVTKSYKKVEVLHPTSLVIEAGKIYGLIGRNGAGKTTLLSLVSGQNPLTSGTVTYGGEEVWENEKAIGEICFSRELSPLMGSNANSYKGKHYLELARCYYPHWDDAYAQRLIQEFELDLNKRIGKLSKGMTSMLTIVLALASRAPITIMDEPVAGLDIAARERFYKMLLDDYQKTGRTFIISTHIIEEAAPVFEEIIFLDKGDLIAKGNLEAFLAQFYYVNGREDQVQKAVEGFTVLNTEQMGRQMSACVKASMEELKKQAENLDVDILPVPLHKIFVFLTGGTKEENIA